MQNNPILTVNDLTVTDKKTTQHIIDQVTFEVQRNRFLGLFGPSGSGKTTLLSTMMRICPASLVPTGEIIYYSEAQQERMIQQGQVTNQGLKLSPELSYIPQNAVEAFDPIEKMSKQFEETFEENSLNKADIQERIAELLVKMDLPESILHQYPFQLSGGMLQRCAIGLTLALQPKVILADEPTAALDSINKKRVVDLLYELKYQQNTTLLLATHDIAVLDYLCDEVLILQEGKKVIQAPLFPSEETDQSYLGKIRKTKQKLSAPFERLRHEKLARD